MRTPETVLTVADPVPMVFQGLIAPKSKNNGWLPVVLVRLPLRQPLHCPAKVWACCRVPKRREKHYKNGKREGLHTSWYENGQKKAEVHFKNGIVVSRKDF